MLLNELKAYQRSLLLERAILIERGAILRGWLESSVKSAGGKDYHYWRFREKRDGKRLPPVGLTNSEARDMRDRLQLGSRVKAINKELKQLDCQIANLQYLATLQAA